MEKYYLLANEDSDVLYNLGYYTNMYLKIIIYYRYFLLFYVSLVAV